jgi:hypothetical protein
MPAIVVNAVLKGRLDDMKDGMEQAKGRTVSYQEVLEAILAELDRAREANPA